MKILVSDTSVLIDLERGDLLQPAFSLGWQLAVPDILYERELRDTNGPALLDLGLRVEELSAEAVAQAQSYIRRQSKLSAPDGFALSLAKSEGWSLLAGDSALRALAVDEGVECRGVLWVLDCMFEGQHVAAQRLHVSLTAISNHPRCRLPAREVKARLERYRPKLV